MKNSLESVYKPDDAPFALYCMANGVNKAYHSIVSLTACDAQRK